jgi:hypothetical protein
LKSDPVPDVSSCFGFGLRSGTNISIVTSFLSPGFLLFQGLGGCSFFISVLKEGCGFGVLTISFFGLLFASIVL